MELSLTILHPFDPWGSKIGGIESVIRSMLHHAPEDFVLSLVGVTEDPCLRPAGRWQALDFRGKSVRFCPLFPVLYPNRRTCFPLFLRFPLWLRKAPIDLSSSIAFYHRIEPLAFTALPAKANVLCVHGDPREINGPHSEVRWRHIPGLYRRMEMWAMRKTHRLFVVSRKGVNYFQDRYPMLREKVSFLPTWVRDEIFFSLRETERGKVRQEWAARFRLQEDTNWILFAARWEAQKNPLLALQVMQVLAARDSSIHLFLAGGGALEPEIQSAIEKFQIGDRVHRLGSLSPERLAEVMRVCDLFLMTSRFEGMPVAAMEALSCGLPVVSTEAGEIRFILEEGRTGRVVGSDSQSLADAVLEIFHCPEIYDRESCARSVQSLRPQSVLPGFFEELRNLG